MLLLLLVRVGFESHLRLHLHRVEFITWEKQTLWRGYKPVGELPSLLAAHGYR